MAIIADSRDKTETLLNVAVRFYREAELQLNVGKCTALRLCKGRGVLKQVYEVNSACIKTLGRGELFRYLGADVPVDGLDRPAGIVEQLAGVLNPITNSKLSPDAKVTVLQTHGLPRLTYRLVHGEMSPLGPFFVDEDRLIREAVKRWCNAPGVAQVA